MTAEYMSEGERSLVREQAVIAVIEAVKQMVRDIDNVELASRYKYDVRMLAKFIYIHTIAEKIPEFAVGSYVENFIRDRQMQLGMMPTSDSEE